MRELFVEKVIDTTEDFLDNNQRIKLKGILTEICLNYQIEMIEQTKKQETQKNNTDILNKFISSKEIEGCSTRTLNYYKDNINKMLDTINLPIDEITTEILRNYLAEEGRIDINKPISTYIDTSLYFKNKENGNKITVKQLLNQNSGIGTYQKLGSIEITKNYGRYEYANANYNLLGKIIESVSNESYSDYVTKNIFEPLEMNHTSATLEGNNKNGLVKGYQNYFGFPIAIEPNYPTDNSWIQVPAGFISSSVSDMGKYLQMYLNNGFDIVTEDSINKMFYDYIPQDEIDRDYYGMGWVYTKYYSKPVLTHSGLVENYTSKMFIIPESNIGIVVLVNMNDYLVTNNLLEDIVKPLLGEEKPEVSNNLYIINHLLIDAIYILITIIALYPFITIKSWKNKDKTKKLYIIDIIRHLLLPIVLILIPTIISVPFWVIWDFVKDLALILIINSILMLSTGIYKIGYLLKKKTI